MSTERSTMEPWHACEQPERPPDGAVFWHYRVGGRICKGCAFKAAVQQHRYPDDPHVRWLVGMVGPSPLDSLLGAPDGS